MTRLEDSEGSGAQDVRPQDTISEERAALGGNRARAEAERRLEPGERVGRFVVVGIAGRGGMGVVYVAYDPELDRKVALKLVRVRETDSTSASRGRLRLQREAQAMARLSHPNVVTVHDVGVYGEQVFLAMEFVEGETLKNWLKEKPRSWREVLRVFKHAGEGLAAAHAANTIHRDFKPSNVLIGRDGRVRVMDFGVARAARGAEAGDALDPAQTAGKEGQKPVSLDTPLTRVGALVGTPGYMAPEQYEGRDVDARSDQHGFCAALYEALYGERPFKGRSVDELRANMLAGRVVEAPKESKVPAWLRRTVLRGLAANPAERHANMTALLAALERDPAIRRRKWALAAGALALVVGLGWGGGQWMRRQSLLCKSAAANLAGVWDAPRKTAVEAAFKATGKSYAADTWVRVLPSLDDYASAWVAMHTQACRATRIEGNQSEELLDLRMSCLAQRLQEVRALVDVFANADATVLTNAVKAVQSLAPLKECADVAALTAVMKPPKDEASRAKVEEVRGRLAVASALHAAGKYKEGLALAQATLGASQTMDYLPVQAEALFLHGLLADEVGEYQVSAESLRRAFLAGHRAAHDVIAAKASTRLVLTLGNRLRDVEAAELWRSIAQATVTRAREPDPALQATLAMYTGILHVSREELREAIEYEKQAMALYEKAMGPQSERAATARGNLAAILWLAFNFDESLEQYQSALSTCEKVLGPRHPGCAYIIAGTAQALLDLGRFSAALPFIERVHAIALDAYGPTSILTTGIFRELGRALCGLGKYEQGLAYLERSLSARRKAGVPAHVAESFTGLSDCLQRQGRLGEALRHCQDAVSVLESAKEISVEYLSPALTGLGKVLVRMGDARSALPYLERAAKLVDLEGPGGAVTLTLTENRFALARALWDAGGDRRRAIRLAQKAREGFARPLSETQKELAEVDAWLAKRRLP